MICPGCGQASNDDWPIEVDGQIKGGGCQDRWERQTDAAWWEAVEAQAPLMMEGSSE